MNGTVDLAAFAELEQIGRGPRGLNRLAWTPEVAEAEAWFARQAREAGLTVERDAAGNFWAVPDAPGPWWATGSHLDTVRDGGAYDGGLGVAAAFAAARACSAPIAVIAFADEEGARFNTPTFGSRAMTGVLDLPAVLDRTDNDGVTLAEALACRGVNPHRLLDAQEGLRRLRGFLELHIDQSTDVAEAGAAIGVVSHVAARRRLRVEIEGVADHAGTTPPAVRRDALAAAADLIAAALRCGPQDPSLRRTATRILAEPNAATTIAGHVRVWLDGRATGAATLDAWVAAVEEQAQTVAAAQRVEIAVAVESASEATEFAPEIVGALTAAAPEGTPLVTCFAGHDAALLGRRIPAGMVLVRNRTGVSHSPQEHVSLDDAAAGAEALAQALEALAAS